MIMDVRDFLESSIMASTVADVNVDLDGWLTIIDADLYLLEKEPPEDYRKAIKIRISDWNIVYAIRQAILPLGGGESFVFHRARVVGLLRMGTSPVIDVVSLYIQERGDNKMVPVDISQDAINTGRTRYEAALKFDFFKEMGDT